MSVNKYINGKLLQLSGNADTRLTTDDIINILEYTPASSDGSNATGEWGIDITGNATTSTNADTVDGRHASSFVYKNSYTIDLTDTSVYDENTWYPVTGSPIPAYGRYRIQVVSPLNGLSKPSWSTHAGGFTCNMDLNVRSCGWGATNGSEMCTDYSWSFTSDNIAPCGYTQMRNSGTPVLYLRGGGKFVVYMDYDSTWTIRTEDYTSSANTVSPVTEAPGVNLPVKAIITARVTHDGDNNEIASTYLPLSGGTMTGDISVPTATAPSDFGSVASVPASGANISISDITELKNYKTYLGSMTCNGAWNNIISTRHRNGGGSDGTAFGMYIRSSLTGAGSLFWGKQYNETWQSERTILDSSNFGSYAVPLLTGYTSMGNGVGGWYRIAQTDNLKTHGSFILTIDRDYNNTNSESHTFAINYAFQKFNIVELNSCICSKLITDVRIVWNGHTSAAYLEVYYNSPTTNSVRYTISSRMGHDCGWTVISNAPAGEAPEGYNTYKRATVAATGSSFGYVNLIADLEFSDSGTSFRGVKGTCAANDLWRVGGAGTADNAGYMEIATADDASEPIYVRQYTGQFATLTRTLTLLDGSGNTYLPGRLHLGSISSLGYESGSQTVYQSAGTTETGTSVLALGNNSTQYYLNTIIRGYRIYFNPYYTISSSAGISTASDEKVKTFTEDIQTDEEKLVKLFDKIKPKSYQYNYSHSDNLNIGFSAQDVEKAMLELDIDPEKYGILNISYNHMLSRGDGLEDSKYYTKFYEISYNDLFSLSLLKLNVMEKQHVERLNSLEERLSALESK